MSSVGRLVSKPFGFKDAVKLNPIAPVETREKQYIAFNYECVLDVHLISMNVVALYKETITYKYVDC